MNGFTLLEVLIALFVFTILSVMLMSALHNIINYVAGTEKSAERLRNLQFAFLIMSRDIEQAVNRPIYNASGKEEKAFIGEPRYFTFTHLGAASTMNVATQSALQRTRYAGDDNKLWRISWAALDQAPQSQASKRLLLNHVNEVRFEYLDKEQHFHARWPVEGKTVDSLPRAVRVYLTIPQWGNVSQLYVISGQESQVKQPRKP